MKSRCDNHNHKRYYMYGARGIGYCKEWTEFKSFGQWAYSSGYTEKLTLDRKNNNLGYSPDNCRWATVKEQANNRRTNHLFTQNKQTRTVSEWADIWGIGYFQAYTKILKLEAKIIKDV